MTPLFARARALLIVVVLGACSAWLYTTPTGQHVRDSVKQALPDAIAGPSDHGRDAASGARPRSPANPTPLPAPVRVVPGAAVIGDDGPDPVLRTSGTDDEFAGAKRPTLPPPSGSVPWPKPVKRIEGCWSFAYQQDAQDYYVAHPEDELGLDGAKGPRNGDGIACGHLPIDPARAASTPFWPWEPAIPTKAQLVSPAGRYFGVAEDGIPGDGALMDKLSTQVGKAPSMVEWFSTWDEPYTQRKVDQAWRRGALPVITWMPAHKGNKVPEDTSQDNILAGKWDDYIRTYARAVEADGKPVVLRFAHEQNGNWYPWSAGGNRAFYNGTRGEPYANTTTKFIAMWRHVWQIFQDEGANDYAIWAWTPVRPEGINANTTDLTKTSFGLTKMEDSYPGAAYVDWVGVSAYAYQPGQWSYDATFAKSFTRLRARAPGKPILVAETGAAEDAGSISNSTRKAAWIADTLRGLAAEKSLVGFVWFNNTVVDVHTVDGVKVTTDNKWDTSPASLAAFTTGIADPVWLTGAAPDTVVTSTTTSKVTTAATP